MALPQVQSAQGQPLAPVTTSVAIADLVVAFSAGITKQEGADVSTRAAKVSLIAAQERVLEAEAVVDAERKMTGNILAGQHSTIDALLTLLEQWKLENPLPVAPSPGN